MIRTHNSGWVLLEVLAAVAVLVILVGPLVSGVVAIIERGARTELQADGLGSVSVSNQEAWTWGDRAFDVAWSPGPELRVQVAALGAVTNAVVGIWADGWLVTDAHSGESGQIAIGGATWMDRKGQELVIRVRQDDGPWGPPWRSLVPDVTGIVGSATGAVSTDPTDADVVVHPPLAANPRLEVHGNGAEILAGHSGSPFFVSAIPVGPAEVKLDGVTEQSWLSESNRGLDVYF